MSFQEIKDEYKESEGQPEVKRKIREKQREAAMASMIEAIQDADVVVTNPNHFAVALSYQVGGTAAPVVIAKGMNLIAERIKEEAKILGIIASILNLIDLNNIKNIKNIKIITKPKDFI